MPLLQTGKMHCQCYTEVFPLARGSLRMNLTIFKIIMRRNFVILHITSKRNPSLTSFMMGKRDPRFSDFMMGKRDPRFSDFMMGKRDPRFSDFIMGKRDPRFSDFMMGKRDPRFSDFMMGKRDSRLSDFMLGKRDPRFSDFIMGKRDPRLSEFMLGKRDARITDFMLGKRDARLSDFMMGRRELGFDEDENGRQTGHNYFQNEVDHQSDRYVLHGGDLETIEGSRGNVVYDDTDIPNQAEAAEFQELESSSSLKRGSGKGKLHRPQFTGTGKTPSQLWSNLGSGKRSSSVDYEDEDENVITEIKRSADPNPKTSVRRFPPAALHKGLYFGKRAANWADI
ncbi:enterin neuropeptides-like isoform X2 [Anneissia japonica]|uniref:enterin neuropeptides-like isoform X1 n=1 Tax=Anneissia japonica TaxID=1529436 RepID=UPI00142563F7|nr:enterin neuropeptides-like isoform X1 [Anneissia japonica]XP_033111021.1 enterin neuropeptides-like isoform X2 [Anneissia japonica]